MHKSICLLCGSALLYFKEPYMCTCEVCKDVFDSDAACKQGHAICSSCDTASQEELIERFCLHNESTEPIKIALSLMNMLSVPMQGPVNQYLIPAVLSTAYYNQTGDVPEKERKLKQARQEAANVIGDFCGPHGVCCTGIGTGIFISLVADSTQGAEGVWGLANQMTNESLRSIETLGEQRCCKRDILMAIKTADQFIQRHLQKNLNVPEIVACEFRYYNQECLREMCPFRPLEN